MRNLVLALCLLVPALSFAGKQGIVAPSTGALKSAIESSLGKYKAVPKSQSMSKKFQTFLANSANYQRIDLTPHGLQDVVTTAYVAKKIYGDKVFVHTTSMMGPNGGVSSWRKGVEPKF